MITVRTASAIALIICMASPATAGTCRYGHYDGASVVHCDNGYFESSRGGRTRTYGYRNGGFEKYPGAHLPPYANERYR